MPKITPALWAKLTVIFTALVGAFLAGAQDYALAAHPGLDLKHVALGAGLAGLAAAWHRYQPPPPPKPAVDPNAVNGAFVAFFAAVAFGSMLVIVAFTPGCGLTAADAGKVAGCGAAYDACFTAAYAMPADKPTKMAAYAVCRAQVDGKCLGMFDPPPPVASATASASSAPAPSAAPVATPPVASAPPAPSASP